MTARQPTVAVLDDEANMRNALRRLLRLRGYDTALYATGPELLEACRTHRPNCIILDLHMPVMNGFEILEQLAKFPDAPPVIVLTGHDQIGNAERVARLGAKGYFTKPVDQAPLFEAISSLVPPPPSSR